MFKQYDLATMKRQLDHTNSQSNFLISFNHWMIMEVLFYYLQIFNASFFLLYIQIRGALGYKIQEANEWRYK